jgi:hypothetical protein
MTDEKQIDIVTGMPTVSAILIDGEHDWDSPVTPSVRVDVTFDPHNGIINVGFPHKPSGWLSITLQGGQVRLAVFKKESDGNPTWEFFLDEKNEFGAESADTRN